MVSYNKVTMITVSWEAFLRNISFHSPNIPKTNLTPACSAPGCQKTQHYCHTTRRKLGSSSCETQPLEGCHKCPGSCLVPSVGWASSNTERNEHLCEMKVFLLWLQTYLLSNYTFPAGLERTSQTSHAVGHRFTLFGILHSKQHPVTREIPETWDDPIPHLAKVKY